MLRIVQVKYTVTALYSDGPIVRQPDSPTRINTEGRKYIGI